MKIRKTSLFTYICLFLVGFCQSMISQENKSGEIIPCLNEKFLSYDVSLTTMLTLEEKDTTVLAVDSSGVFHYNKFRAKNSIDGDSFYIDIEYYSAEENSLIESLGGYFEKNKNMELALVHRELVERLGPLVIRLSTPEHHKKSYSFLRSSMYSLAFDFVNNCNK